MAKDIPKTLYFTIFVDKQAGVHIFCIPIILDISLQNRQKQTRWINKICLAI